VSEFLAIYRLVIKHQLTRGRVVLVAVGISAFTLLGATVLRGAADPFEETIQFVSVIGLGLLLPVISLLLGGAAMGDWYTDETLVYVWLRPVRRTIVAFAAIAAALTVTLPGNLLPMLAAVLASGQTGNGAITGTIGATAMVTLAYTAVFVLLGITVKRPLAIGLIYIFIWEFFVSRGAAGAARLSINSYGSTILARATDLDLTLADRAGWATVAVPVGVTVVAALLASVRLQRMDVA
jgi:ABC-2 type transport system permease protein